MANSKKFFSSAIVLASLIGCGLTSGTSSPSSDEEVVALDVVPKTPLNKPKPLTMAINKTVWETKTPIEQNFQVALEAQINEVITHGFKNALTFALRDEEIQDSKPLVWLDKIKMNERSSVERSFKSDLIFAHGEYSINFTDYSLLFKFKMQRSDGHTDLVEFSVTDFLHLNKSITKKGSVQTPASTIAAGAMLPSFVVGILTSISPEIGGTQQTNNYIPDELNTKGKATSLFQRAIFSKVFYPLCCSLSTAQCDRLEDVHPLMHSTKQSLMDQEHTRPGLVTKVSCEPSERFKEAFDDTLQEMEKIQNLKLSAQEQKQEKTPEETQEEKQEKTPEEILEIYDRLWFGIPEED